MISSAFSATSIFAAVDSNTFEVNVKTSPGVFTTSFFSPQAANSKTAIKATSNFFIISEFLG